MQHRAPTSLRPPTLQEVIRGMVGVPRAIASWRARRSVSPAWTITAALIAGEPDDFLGQFRRNSHLTAAVRFSY